jgi:uroporphyrinogen-III synthase
MQEFKLRILSTRPLDKEVKSEAQQAGILLEEMSFIKTSPVQNPQLFEQIKSLSTQHLTVAFTSMNAVEAVVNHISRDVDWYIYCIGGTTKRLIEQKLGIDKIAATAESANLLAERMMDDGIKSVVFFCGNIRRNDLPDKLRSEKIKVDEIIVYETTEMPETLTKEYDGILFFSPSGAHSFFKLNKLYSKTQLFAIGKTTAEALRKYTNQKIIISHSPGKKELTRQVIDYYATKKIHR